MEIRGLSIQQINQFEIDIDSYIKTNFKLIETKYLDLGVKTVRILNYSEEFTPHIEKQLTFVLKNKSDKYDATLVLWNEKDVLAFTKKIALQNKNVAMRINLEKVFRKAQKAPISDEELHDIKIFDDSFSKTKPKIHFKNPEGFITCNNLESNTYYYGVKDLSPEEFIKEGHIFVQILNNILKTKTSNLAHGAVIGLNNNGILMCARGQRGKSTLSVLSMMENFEYVSDDYLTLHQNEKNELLSSPIYSIITLSPKMYNELYDNLDGSRFISNNARKDKYVFNISNFHDRFKMNYPIKLCLFPEIVSDKNPSIIPCTSSEKGRAMVQLIQSTLIQTQDLCENWTVKKLMNMIKDYPFYKFNLCHDIQRNTEFLRNFMNNFSQTEHKIIESDKIAIDITFDLANILNTETGIIYSMNEFSTNIFENILNGVSISKLKESLKEFESYNKNILNELNLFINQLEHKEIYKQIQIQNIEPIINKDFANKNQYKLSLIEHIEEEFKELIKENKNELCTK